MQKQQYAAMWCDTCKCIVDSDETHVFCGCITVDLEAAKQRVKEGLWRYATVVISTIKPIKLQLLKKGKKNVSKLVQ